MSCNIFFPSLLSCHFGFGVCQAEQFYSHGFSLLISPIAYFISYLYSPCFEIILKISVQHDDYS